jgi:hypothetical protein
MNKTLDENDQIAGQSFQTQHRNLAAMAPK